MGLCVLFVDGGTDDREMYAECLRAHGFDVIEEGTTDDVATKLAEAHILITGLLVPGSVTPVELIRRIREGPRTAAKPILVLTASTLAPMLDAATRAGADGVLIKPCYPSDLLQEVRRVMRKHGIREVGDRVYVVPVADRRRRPRPA